MSKIVTMKAEVPWVSAQKFRATLEKVMTVVTANHENGFDIRTIGSSRVELRSPGIFGCITFNQEPLTGQVNCVYDSANRRLGERVLNEVIVETVREKAMRNNYRVTVERNSEKTVLLLER